MAVVAYLATLVHGWFDPLFALVILAYPTGRIVAARGPRAGHRVHRRPGRLDASPRPYGARPIAWWDCPTCISTVDAWMTAYDALDPIGRLETLAPDRL